MHYRIGMTVIALLFSVSPVHAIDFKTSINAIRSELALPQEKVNLNQATADDLLKVKGMNASKTRAVIVYRRKHGDFTSVQELRNVKGFRKMKPKRFQAIIDQFKVTT